MDQTRFVHLEKLPPKRVIRYMDSLCRSGEIDPNCMTVELNSLSVGDEVVVVVNGKDLVRGKIVYKGFYETLGYNDKSVVHVRGLRVKGKTVFPQNRAAALLEDIVPRTVDVVEGEPGFQIFRLIQKDVAEA